MMVFQSGMVNSSWASDKGHIWDSQIWYARVELVVPWKRRKKAPPEGWRRARGPTHQNYRLRKRLERAASLSSMLWAGACFTFGVLGAWRALIESAMRFALGSAEST